MEKLGTIEYEDLIKQLFKLAKLMEKNFTVNYSIVLFEIAKLEFKK